MNKYERGGGEPTSENRERGTERERGKTRVNKSNEGGKGREGWGWRESGMELGVQMVEKELRGERERKKRRENKSKRKDATGRNENETEQSKRLTPPASHSTPSKKVSRAVLFFSSPSRTQPACRYHSSPRRTPTPPSTGRRTQSFSPERRSPGRTF